MKLPSIQFMLKGLKTSFVRFAPALLITFIGTAAAIILTFDFARDYENLYRFIFSAALGLPLFIAIRLFCEKNNIGLALQIIFYLIALAFLSVYFFTLPDKVLLIPSTRFPLLLIGFHLLVSFVAFTGRGMMYGFWQFNKTLFLRFLTAVFYSSILYGGLSLAVLAIDKLFGVNLDGRVYLRLWIFIAGFFNTWFFIAGIPGQIASLEQESGFPKGLKIFTQYVLFPLVLIYLIILYAYAFKIIFTWDFPNGWVSYLVVYFSASGIFSLLLVHPIKNTEDNKWVGFISKWFYITLVPMLVLLAIAIWKRIDQYGVTENRYFIVALNVWLVFISIYFTFSKTKNIKLIPLTLCLLAIITSFGPWSTFSIAQKSQLMQFEKTISGTNILINGKIQANSDRLSFLQKHQFVTIVNYLDNANALSKLQPWFRQNIDSLIKADTARWSDKSEKILALMGIEKWTYYSTRRNEGTNDTVNFYYYSTIPPVIPLNGHDYLINYSLYQYYKGTNPAKQAYHYDTTTAYAIANDTLRIVFNEAGKTLSFIKAKKELISLDLSTVLDSVHVYMKKHPGEKTSNNLPNDVMIMEKENERMKVKMIFSTIDGKKYKQKIILIQSLNATVLLKLKAKDIKQK